MKTRRFFLFVCLFMLLTTALHAGTTSISTKSLGLYLGGSEGTEYKIMRPVQTPITVKVGEISVPYCITNYNWGGGIYIEMLATLPQQISGIYDYVVATLRDGTSYRFEFLNGSAYIGFFIPMTSDTNISVYFSME